jgi:hypothetical protein
MVRVPVLRIEVVRVPELSFAIDLDVLETMCATLTRSLSFAGWSHGLGMRTEGKAVRRIGDER